MPLLAVPILLAGCGNNMETGAETNAPASGNMGTNSTAPGGATVATNDDTNTPPMMATTNMPANSSTNAPP